MAIPNPFQKLKHGVLLCKKNFNTFVETFNFLVDFAQNIRGDGDANGDGVITLDRTVQDRPVIRSKIRIGQAGQSIVESKYPSCFDISSMTITHEYTGDFINLIFANCYIQNGGNTYDVSTGASIAITEGQNNILCIKLDAISVSTLTIDYSSYHNLQSMKDDQSNPRYYIIPLYMFDDEGTVLCDYRNIPHIDMAEV